MKKNTIRKNQSIKKKQKVIQKNSAESVVAKQASRSWSISIYVYWFIILFFIAATFYILGRSHGTCTDLNSQNNNVEISEEALLQANDYYEEAKKLLVAGNIADAIDALTTAIEAGNPTVEMYLLRGEAYLQTADYRKALEDFNSVIEMDQINAIAYYDRALLNIRLEDYATALADINNALAAQTARPTSVLQTRDLYAKRGQLNLWLKNWEGAIADYTNSLARPDGVVNPTVYAERAEAYTQLGNYADAISDYASAIRVISEQIQGATTAEEREALSSNAMSYFEKSAALNLALGNIEVARSDLNSAYTIATALVDNVSMERIQNLIAELQ